MVKIQSKVIANNEVCFVDAQLKENVITYQLFNATEEEVGSGQMATDGSITEENLLEVVLSSLGASVITVSENI
jgi:hypothetical protein